VISAGSKAKIALLVMLNVSDSIRMAFENTLRLKEQGFVSLARIKVNLDGQAVLTSAE